MVIEILDRHCKNLFAFLKLLYDLVGEAYQKISLCLLYYNLGSLSKPEVKLYQETEVVEIWPEDDLFQPKLTEIKKSK